MVQIVRLIAISRDLLNPPPPPSLPVCSLMFCSLSCNNISSEGTYELAAALQVNQSLQELK